MAEHVLGAALPSSDIFSGLVETLNGATVKLAVSDMDAITVNDTKVTGADMATSNGIVHVIDTVLSPPTATNPVAAITTATLAMPVNPTDAVAVHSNEAVPVRQTPLFPSRSPTPPNVPPQPRRRQAAALKLPPLPHHRQAAAAVTLCPATDLLPPHSVWTSPPPEPPQTNLHRAVAQREPSLPFAMPSSSVTPSPSLSPSRRRAAQADPSAARPHAR